MKQIVRIVWNNILHSKLKGIMIILLISFSMFTAVVSYSLNDSITSMVKNKTEALDATAKIKVISKNRESLIALSLIDYIEEIEGVRNVLPQYNIYGLLEKDNGIPIYNVSINGFDFENNIFIGADDFRGKNVSGILLPDITVSLQEEMVLKDLIGTDVVFIYEYISDGTILSQSITAEVIGVYEASGVFEENPIYFSIDLFAGILANNQMNISGISSADIYLNDAEHTESVAEKLEQLGLEVFYESTVEDYIESLEGFVSLSMTIVIVILIFAIIIIIQTVWANIKKRYAIIAVMKAYGYSTMSICFMVWFEIFSYCLSAIVVTIVLCIVGQSGVQDFFSSFLPGLAFVLNKETFLMLVMIGVLTSCISAIIPCKNLIKLNPVDILKIR